MSFEIEGGDVVAVGGEQELVDLLAQAEALVDEPLEVGSQTILKIFLGFDDLPVSLQTFLQVVGSRCLTSGLCQV